MRRNATDSEKYIWKRCICRLLAKTYKDPHPEGMETKTPQCSFLPSTGLKSPAQAKANSSFSFFPLSSFSTRWRLFLLETFILASYCSLCSNGSQIWLCGVFVCRSSTYVQWILRISKETEEHGFLCAI